MSIKNYSTGIEETKTVGEIMGLLASKGARSIRIDYDDLNRPASISFILVIKDFPLPFKLPCNFDGVLKAMARDYTSNRARYRFENNAESMVQARRVAWRIIKDWVAAQMALVEAEQAALAQVFLPYAIFNEKSGKTMFTEFIEQIGNKKQLSEAVA